VVFRVGAIDPGACELKEGVGWGAGNRKKSEGAKIFWSSQLDIPKMYDILSLDLLKRAV